MKKVLEKTADVENMALIEITASADRNKAEYTNLAGFRSGAPSDNFEWQDN